MINNIINSLKCLIFILSSLFITDNLFAKDYKLEKDVRYRSLSVDSCVNNQCVLDIYYPTKCKDFTTVIWFHGGGLTTGKKELPEALLNKGICVVGVGYRLCSKDKSDSLKGNVTTEDIVDDAAAAAAWVMNNIERYGGDTNKIYLAGHSAGGYLVSMIGLNKTYLKKYNVDADQFAALIPFSGQMITHFQNRRNRGMNDYQPLIDKHAPLFHIRKDCPPILLITGDRNMEMLGRYEENAYMWRMLQLVGHKSVYLYELDGFDHGSMSRPAFFILLNYIRKNNS